MASKVLISRLRESFPEDHALTDEQLLTLTKGTLLRAGIEIGIAKEQLVKTMAKQLPILERRLGKIRILRNIK